MTDPAPPSVRGRSERSAARRAGPGFTLIELLVVIGVVAVLLAITLAALPGVRRSSQRVVCLSNLSSLGDAAQMALDANDGVLPRASSTYLSGESTDDAPTGMLAVFGPHLDSLEAFHCPSDPDLAAWPPADASLPYEVLEERSPIGHHSSYLYTPGGLMELGEALLPIPVPPGDPDTAGLRDKWLTFKVTQWYLNNPEGPLFSDPYTWSADAAGDPSPPARHPGGPKIEPRGASQFGTMWGAQQVTFTGGAGWASWHVNDLVRDFLGLGDDEVVDP